MKNFWEEEYKELWQITASWIDARPDQEDEALKALRQEVGLRHPNRVKRRE